MAVDVKIELWTYLEETGMTGSKDRGETAEKQPSLGRSCRRQSTWLSTSKSSFGRLRKLQVESGSESCPEVPGTKCTQSLVGLWT